MINKFLKKIPYGKIILDKYYNYKTWQLYKPLIKKLQPSLSPPKTILIYPKPLFSSNPLALILYVLGYKITTNPYSNYDLVMRWEDQTFKPTSDILVEIAKTKKVINLNSNDISKKNVDRVFRKIFGYHTEIDPLTFEGIALQKGNLNFKKDGQEIQCPIEKVEDGYIYQIVINSRFDEKYVEDFRVPVFKNTIPFVYQKLISVQHRFSDLTEKAYLKSTQEVFSADEISKIIQLCQEMKVEYAELDILRNRDDGKIYIVDVNDTPGAPPGNKRLMEGIDVFEHGARQEAIEKLAITFYEQFVK